jgi:hypothetical protein
MPSKEHVMFTKVVDIELNVAGAAALPDTVDMSYQYSRRGVYNQREKYNQWDFAAIFTM